MNTRSGNKPNSSNTFTPSQRGRPRTRTPSSNNFPILIDSSVSTSARPKVLHTPPEQKGLNSSRNSAKDKLEDNMNLERNPIDRTMEENNLHESQENIRFTQRTYFSHTQFHDMTQALSRDQISINPDNLDNSNALNPTPSVSMDSLINMFQEIMRNTQEEFRKEFNSLKNTIRNDPGPNSHRQTPGISIPENQSNTNQGSFIDNAFVLPPERNYNYNFHHLIMPIVALG